MSNKKSSRGKLTVRYFISRLVGEDLITKDIPSDELSAINDMSAIYIYCSKELKKYYIGQTNSIIRRHGEHIREFEGDTPKYEKYFREGKIAIFYGNEISSNLNYIEQSLIKLFKEFGAIHDFELLNTPNGNKSDFVQDKREGLDVKIIHEILCVLQNHHILSIDSDIKVKSLNSLLYRHTPFYELGEKQLKIMAKILESVNCYEESDGDFNVYIIRGGAGTGKTVLMNHIIAHLFGNNINSEKRKNRSLKIGVCLKPNMVKSITKIFKSYGYELEENNLYIGKWMDILLEGEKKEFDYIFVDEAHRLIQYKNYIFPEVHKLFLKDREEENVLNLILAHSNRTVLFYDDFQRLRPTDIEPLGLKKSYNQIYNFTQEQVFDEKLSIQYRIKINSNLKTYNMGCATNYVKYLKYVLGISQKKPTNVDFLNTDYFKIVENLSDVKEYIEHKRSLFPYKNSRVLAGSSRKDKWSGKRGTPNRKIDKKAWHEIDMIENRKYQSWASVDSEENRNQVGSIHSAQGYDFDYIGLIIGNDIKFSNGEIMVDKKNYCDSRGKIGLNDSELKSYIVNVYYTLLTRGIYGIRVYIEDDKLKEYWKDINEKLLNQKSWKFSP